MYKSDCATLVEDDPDKYWKKTKKMYLFFLRLGSYWTRSSNSDFYANNYKRWLREFIYLIQKSMLPHWNDGGGLIDGLEHLKCKKTWCQLSESLNIDNKFENPPWGTQLSIIIIIMICFS